MVTPATENERESRPRRRVTARARVKDEGWAEMCSEAQAWGGGPLSPRRAVSRSHIANGQSLAPYGKHGDSTVRTQDKGDIMEKRYRNSNTGD